MAGSIWQAAPERHSWQRSKRTNRVLPQLLSFLLFRYGIYDPMSLELLRLSINPIYF